MKDPAKELAWEFSAWELAKEIKVDKNPVTGDVFIKQPLHTPRVSCFSIGPGCSRSWPAWLQKSERQRHKVSSVLKATKASWQWCRIIMTRSDLYNIYLCQSERATFFSVAITSTFSCTSWFINALSFVVFWTLHPLHPVFWSVSQTKILTFWGLFHQHLQCHVHTLLTFLDMCKLQC